ncbi:MAG: tRNA (adenosine(37)-N6)-dimethylallyltransferase MiaA [Actinomycetota bacterium]|nr:tRNA (adenosine(37)-N6)-dimethylallyltransferase MiaA [Actinomycetota bacterium]
MALETARHLDDVEVVSADSMQVYRGMDIGTAKPSVAEQVAVAHHLIDLVDPAGEWSVTDWLAAATDAVDGIERRGHRALLVGGSGLYVHALVDGFTPPGRYPQIRADLEAEVDAYGEAGLARLYRMLNQVDPAAAARMEPTNRRRVIRALEVTLGGGTPFSQAGPGITAHPPTRWRLAGLWLPRPAVAERIERRFDAMVDAGLVDEVAGLAAAMGPTSRQALGYREVLGHLEDGVALPEAREVALRRTRAFARRQRMWWRRDPRIAWVGTSENPLAVVAPLLRNWSRP